MTEIKTYTLIVTEQDLQILAQALEQVAFKFAAPLFNKINAQIQEQLNPAPAEETSAHVPPQ